MGTMMLNGRPYGNTSMGNQEYSETELWSGNITQGSGVLSEPLTAYDAIMIFGSGYYESSVGNTLIITELIPTNELNYNRTYLLNANSGEDRRIFIAFSDATHFSIDYYGSSYCNIHKILGIKYATGGTVVEANPRGIPTRVLDTVKINNHIYKMNDNSFYKETSLYNVTGSTSFVDIHLDDSVLNYDMIVIYLDWDYTLNYDNIFSGQVFTYQQLKNRAGKGSSYRIIGLVDEGHAAQYTLSTDGKTLSTYSNSGGTNIRRIVGIKFGNSDISPIIYSEEERKIGVWKNNKPLYQKTFMLSLTNNSTLIPNTSDIETLAAVKGYVYGDGVNTYLPYSDGEDAVGAWNDSSGVSVYVTSWFLNNGRNQCCITLQYTKTTDIPGSGQYNTLGVPTVHYSTDEQIIGTWIDGSTLYETTFHNVTVHNTGDTLIPTPSNWNVVKLDGYLGRSPDMEHVFLPFQASSIYCRLYADYNVYGGILLESNIEGAATITARYTKTTS